MHEFPGYTFVEDLYRGTKNDVFRAKRQSDGRSVVLKVPRSDRPRARRMAELRHERDVVARLPGAGVVQVLGFEEHGHRCALVLEDFGGITLRQHLDRAGRMAPRPFLQIALQLCDAIADIHRQGILHKDIKPHNLLIHPGTGTVKVADFSIASLLASEVVSPANLGDLVGTLAYMAPEQTGRMNRGVDERTDLYSLGMTFYELLTNRKPFPQRDALALVHAHIALVPQPLHEVCPDVPRALSAIVSRLVAKNAEDRYQSVHGLKADLEECLRQLRERGRIDDGFVAGRHDRARSFRLPQRLYGRDPELAELTAAFERASRGPAELLLVTGYAGVGKSALVNELQKHILRRRGLFVSGKFDQLNRAVPYAPVAKAFRELLRQILMDREEELARWRRRILASVGSNGQLLIDIIPELELVIGPQPAVPELGPTEAQNRFALVLQNFVRAFAAEEHPLVVFLDDLQWADPASLKVLALVLSDPESRNLLAIAAYRDAEIDAAHLLASALGQLRGTGAAATEVHLRPLALEDVVALLSDAVAAEPERARPLAALVFEKTHGNPFFVSRFLTALYEDGLLAFDAASSSFTWDLEAVRDRMATDNVVDLMASKIVRLTPDTQRLLRLAACIGYQFDLQTLSTIDQRSPAETARALWDALREGLVLPIDSEYRLIHGADDGRLHEAEPGDLNASYKFLHDRVQQAAYAFIEEGRRLEVHLQIGRLVLARSGGRPRDDELFDVVNHLNTGAALITDPAERVETARLNLGAGRKAKTAAAYEAAAGLFRAGVEILPEMAWEEHPALALALYKERAEAEYLTGHFDAADRLCSVALGHARTPLEEVEIRSIQAAQYQLQGRYAEAIRIQRRALELLGWPLPEDEPRLAAMLEEEMRAVDVLLRGRNVEDLLGAPRMEDPRCVSLLPSLQSLFYAAYLNDEKTLSSLAVVKMVTLSLEHGNAELSAFGYIGYGMLAGALLGDWERGRRFGSMGIELADRFDNVAIRCLANYLYAADVHSWSQPLKAVDPYYDRTHAYGLESGDWLTVGYMIINSSSDRLTRGDPLPEVLAWCRSHVPFLERAKNHDAIDLLRAGVIQPALALQGKTAGPLSFDGEGFREEEYLSKYGTLAYHLAWLHYAKIRNAYLFDDVESFAGLWDRLSIIETAVPTHANKVPETTFYAALMRLRACADAGDAARGELIAAARRLEDRLGRWSASAPANVRHKHLIVQAERARVEIRPIEAMDLYEQAIEAAKAHGAMQDEALANELYGRFWLAQGRSAIARIYLAEAHEGYVRWGATAKARKLLDRHARLFVRREAVGAGQSALDLSVATITASPAGAVAEGSGPSYTTSRGGVPSNRGLDIGAVLQASHAFANEMDLDRLLEKVLQIAVQNAGAERGVLVLERDGRLVVAAEQRPEDGRAIRLEEVPIDESDAAAASVVHLVHRTAAPLVLEDAAREGAFTRDPYVQRRATRSVLCTPLVRKGSAVGALYLENNLTPGAFTSDRLEVLRLLSAEIAISLENALLYTGLKETLDHLSALNRAYRLFVPHEMLALLGKQSLLDVRLGDHVQRDMTVLFADIRSFTTMSEAMSPRETFDFVNAYLAVMGPLIRMCGGYIDKYIGDGIMALFPERADDAIEAAISMLRRLSELNAGRFWADGRPIGLRIGVHTGGLILGVVGEQERMEGTVISDVVNIAARLENLCERYGVGLIASEDVLSRCEDRSRFPHRRLGRVTVRGKARAVEVFEIFSGDDAELAARKGATKPDFELAVECLAQNDASGAVVHLRNVLREAQDDAAARFLMRQAAELLQRSGA